MGILPDIWGPHAWNLISAIALSYPEEADMKIQQDTTAFLTSLQLVLPCERCREHFKENLEKYPLSQALGGRYDFIKWVIDVRNSINEKNGKKLLTYEEGQYYMKRNLYGRQWNKKHIMLGMTGFIGIYFILSKTKFFKNLLK